MPAKSSKKNGRRKRSKRRSTAREIADRRSQVKRLYFVRHWTARDIADKVDINGRKFSERQIKRDIAAIRKEFKAAKKNGEGNLDDIIRDITFRSDERVQILWNDLAKVERDELSSMERQKELEALLATSEGSERLQIIAQITKYKKRLDRTLAKKLFILEELRKCDDSFVANLSKLGFATGDGGIGDGDLLVEIRARREKIKITTNNPGDSDGSS